MKHSYLKALSISLLIVHLSFQNLTDAQNTDNFKGYGNATCSALKDNIFIKNWLILGPLGFNNSGKPTVDDATIRKAFDDDIITSVTVDPLKSIEPIIYVGKKYTWKNYSGNDNIIKLDDFLGDTNYVICYVLSEIIAPEAKKVLVGLGSDDGVKVWINGKEVHKEKIGRPVTIDDDIFEIALNKGSNQVLIKIQNERHDYGFSFRPLGKDIVSDLMIQNSGSGDFDNVKMLMNYSPDLKKTNSVGLTAWQLATVKGRTEIAQYLEKNGAVKINTFPPITTYVEKTLAPFTGKDSVPGMAVLIAKDGKVIYKNGFGFANLDGKIPVTTTTKFRIGSITKQFIAASILRLQEQGKINVTDKLSAYLPEFPRGNEVTIYQLLTHTSGIHSYTDNDNFDSICNAPISDSSLLKLIASAPFDFDPGIKFQYCNSGYIILGCIVSKTSGKSLSDYLADEFFKPLGMKNSGIYNNANKPSKEAIGYTFQNGKIDKAKDWDMSWAGGAGAIYSTVEDLFLWNEAVFNGKVLNENSLNIAFTPAKLNNGEQVKEMAYGFGWVMSDYRGMKFIFHSGGLDGFLSYLERQPEENLTVAALTNSTPPLENFYPGSVGDNIAEYVLWPKMAAQTTYSLDTSLTAEQLKAFTGRYDYGMGMVLTVSLEGKNLNAQMAGQEAFEIYYMGTDEFFWKVVEARIKFVRDNNGIITGGIHYQGGQEIKVVKLPDQIIPAVDTSLTIEQLKAYTGKYDYGQGMILTVSLDENNLMAQMTGQPAFQIFYKGNDEFFWKVVDASIIFVRNEHGVVTGAKHNQGGMQLNVSKMPVD